MISESDSHSLPRKEPSLTPDEVFEITSLGLDKLLSGEQQEIVEALTTFQISGQAPHLGFFSENVQAYLPELFSFSAEQRRVIVNVLKNEVEMKKELGLEEHE